MLRHADGSELYGKWLGGAPWDCKGTWLMDGGCYEGELACGVQEGPYPEPLTRNPQPAPSPSPSPSPSPAPSPSPSP